MTRFSYTSDTFSAPALGLIVLQTDETIEGDMRTMLPAGARLHVSRVPSGAEVTSETLDQMAGHLTASASLLPEAAGFGVVGYGCTSGTAQIGAARIASLVQAGIATPAVTEPVTALVAACRSLGVTRIAFLSPYVASVSERLRSVLSGQGIETPVFGGFDEAEEAKVVRIDAPSIHRAAADLVRDHAVDAIFLSCTNLRTLSVIAALERDLDMPVLSSNQVLAWHMGVLAGEPASGPGRLFDAQP